MSLPDWLAGSREELLGRLRKGTLPHALLLLGGAGLGKRALARWLCQRALCTQAADGGDACGTCRSCKLFLAGSHPDYVSCAPAEGKQQIAVDQIRELIAKAALTRSESAYQVFLLEEAERMNANAANALLKTLEEPTPDTLLILLAERRDALPATVLSRCQVLNLKTPNPEQALAWMRASNPGLGDEQLRSALRAAGGSPGLAAELIGAELEGEVGALGESLVAIAQGRHDVSQAAALWAGQHPDHRLRWMANLLRGLIWRRLGGPTAADAESLERVAAGADLEALFACYQQANRCRRLLAGSLRVELLIEDLLLAWQRAASPHIA